jgi:DNA-binding PadR family transcriptional regulator
MDLLDPLANVRLKFFLASQAERRSGANAGAPERPAGILTALALMEQYSSRPMNGEEIRSLFQGLSASGLSNVMRSLNSKSLVERDRVYYRITPLGAIFLVRVANEVLRAPTLVETEFRQNNTYRDLMKSAEEVVDKDLRQRFELAMRKRRGTTKTDSLPAIHRANCRDAEPMTQ